MTGSRGANLCYPVGLRFLQHSFGPGPGTSSGIYWLTLGKQVTASSLRLVDAKTRRQLTEWKAPAPISINVATANVSQVCPLLILFICIEPR